MYTGTLINDLFDAVERAEKSTQPSQPQGTSRRAAPIVSANPPVKNGCSEPEQFPQTLGLSPADGNLGLLFIVHAQLVGALEPGHDFADAVHVYEI